MSTPRFLIKLFFILFLFLGSLQNLQSQTYQWREITNGPEAIGTRFEDVYFINNNTGWIIDTEGIVYGTKDGGRNWMILYANHAAQGFRSIAFFDSTHGILGSLDSDSVLFITTNGGVNWTLNTNITGTIPLGVCGINIAGPNLAFASGRYNGPPSIIKTTDKGVTWTALNFGSYVTTLIDVYFLNENTGFVNGGTGANFGTRRTAILRTTNSGASWDSVYVSTSTGEWGWKFDFLNSTTGYCSVERSAGALYYLKTTNAGVNWTPHFYNLNPLPKVQGICFLNENTGWVGGGHDSPPIAENTYRTTNGGITWGLIHNMLNVNVFQLLSDTLGFAVGKNVYRFSNDTMTSVENISDIIPDNYELKQNYPNPFNPTTKIEFNVAKSSNIKLTVFDMLGKNVATLVNQNLKPGSYKIEWNAENSPSGVYYYKLETESFSETKKMILIK